MNPFPDGMSAIERARASARALGFVGITASMLAMFLTHEKLARPDEATRDELFARYKAKYLRRALRVLGVELTLEAGLPPVARGPRLVVANHRAALDIPIAVHLYGGEVLSMAELGDWPLLGTVARVSGTIFVDRKEGASRAAAAKVIRERLRARHTVVVFPEGRTYQGDEVHEFAPGAFLGGRELEDLEIAPLGLAYQPGTEFTEDSFTEHLTKNAGRPRIPVVASVGEPFLAAGRGPRELAREAHDRVVELVKRARTRFEEGA